MKYTYETLPGQTIVRCRTDGYTERELLIELANSGDGVVVTDDDYPETIDAFVRSIEGCKCRDLMPE